MRILCLEDDPAWAELLENQLRDSVGRCFILRVDSRDAFQRALAVEAGFDLILADYVLPGFDGMSALALARELAPEVPFIFISGSLGEELAIESLKKGATDFLVKGNHGRLGSAVTRALREARELRERRLAERKIAEQARLLDLASDGIMVCDLASRIRFWNDGAGQIFGWLANDAIGERLPELLKLEDSRCQEAFSFAMRDGKWRGELRARSRTGGDLVVSLRMTLVQSADGTAESILIIGTDVTEKKQLEAQFLRAQRLEGVGLLASGIAHDLNNILAPILMAAPLLKMDALRPENLDLLSTIEISAQRGAGLVKQILSFARGSENGCITMDLRMLLNEIARFARETFPRSISIQTKLPTDLWAVRGDATQLHQVFLNLCINARDAMSAGGSLEIAAANVSLRPEEMSGEPRADATAFVRISITDTGDGIPEEIQERIFEPFFTTKEADKGTGLGLASVKNIVAAHAGFLKLRSRCGSGTSFELFFPAAEQPAAESGAGGFKDSPRGHGELILVVDDEAQIREVSRRVLELNGYRVETAGDGMEAIAAFARHRDSVRVLITDTDMPKIDGQGLIRILLRMRPDLSIVASGGKLSAEDREAFRALSVRQFLDKPYQPDQLLAAAHGVMQVLTEPVSA